MLSGFCGSHIAERGGIHAQVTSFVYYLDREVARSWRKAVLRRRYGACRAERAFLAGCAYGSMRTPGLSMPCGS